MRRSFALAVLFVSATLLAQTPPPACPANRPVDEIITEVHNQQSKKKHRNTDPFPDVGCIFGWCRIRSTTPPTVPEPAPRAEKPTDVDTGDEADTSTNTCDTAMEKALQAAHNVDVGDYYFGSDNFMAALFRYQDAAKDKPKDAAIHVRLGRAYEKLKQPAKAMDEYTEAQKLQGPQKWSDEAKSALARLQSAAH